MQQEVIIKGVSFDTNKYEFRYDLRRVDDLVKNSIKVANQKYLLKEMYNTRLCPTPLVERDKDCSTSVEDKYSAELEKRGFKPNELKCDMIIIKAIQFHDCVIQISKFKHPVDVVVSIHPDLMNYLVNGRTLMFTHKITKNNCDSYYYIRFYEYMPPSPLMSDKTTAPAQQSGQGGQTGANRAKDDASYKLPEEYMKLAKIDPSKNYIILCVKHTSTTTSTHTRKLHTHFYFKLKTTTTTTTT